jgi:cyanate lyase
MAGYKNCIPERVGTDPVPLYMYSTVEAYVPCLRYLALGTLP